MKFSYKEVRYTQCARVGDQATAFAQLTPSAIILVMPQDVPKSLKFYCPCGCGQVLTINLMPKAAKAWSVTFEQGRGFSLWPSVWLDTGCKSHFILRHNTAWLLFGDVPEDESPAYWESIFGKTDSSP